MEPLPLLLLLLLTFPLLQPLRLPILEPLLASFVQQVLSPDLPAHLVPFYLAPCAGSYDCTSHHNNLLQNLGRVASVAACHRACLANPRCHHFTYNYLGSRGNYPGACFLFSSCSVRHPGAGQWVSAPRDCNNPTMWHQHFTLG